jgi:hypothetical protein
MLAWAYADPQPSLSISVYVGLSPSYCFWHYADPRLLLGNDLYKKAVGQLRAQNDWLWVSETEG